MFVPPVSRARILIQLPRAGMAIEGQVAVPADAVAVQVASTVEVVTASTASIVIVPDGVPE